MTNSTQRSLAYWRNWTQAEKLKLLQEGQRRLQEQAPKQPAPKFDEWASTYLSHYFTLPRSKFHNWLSHRLGRLQTERGSRVCVLAPRISAKSTWSTMAYPLYCAVHGLEQYIILTSDTGDQAEKYLSSVRDELELNPLLERDYPDVFGKGPMWKAERIVLKNGVMIESVGTGKKIRGRKNRQHRPSLIVVDDPQNLEHIISPLQRERTWEWLTKDVSNAGDPQTNIVVLGTALHRECIVCKLQTTAGWQTTVFRSIEVWPKRMDLWSSWEAILNNWEDPDREVHARQFYEANKGAMHE